MNEWMLAASLVILMAHSVKSIVLLMWAGTGQAEDIDMSPSPLVSVLIPCFNEERVLEATVAAIFDSRGVKFHSVICVDDGSTDRTLNLARTLKISMATRSRFFLKAMQEKQWRLIEV